MRGAALTAVVAAVLVAAVAGRAGAQTVPTFGCPASGQAWKVTPALPSDVSPVDQPNMNCFAWQEFIALNWAADPETCAADPAVPASAFGDPDATGPVVWETYKAPADVFLPGAAKPPGWCSAGDRYGAGDPKRLSHKSKFAANEDVLDEIHEAAPANSWLTAQNGNLTLYEIRLNQDEFDFVVDEQLYDAEQQAKLAQSDTGLYLPMGSGGTTGAIELKAAWLEIEPERAADFLTAKAIVKYPGEGPREALVGLVGLHIIHKTASARQFVWATFEHVDNVPTPGDKPGTTYTYNDPACDPATDHYQCRPNQAPNPAKDPHDAPMQVTRVNPLDSPGDEIEALNERVWAAIGKATTGRSVFLNYRLINVLWPSSNPAVTGPQTTPVPTGPTLPQATVANTTLETFRQTATCLSCHVYATAAGTENFGSDFSFVLSHAQASASAPAGDGVPGALVAGGAAAAAAAAIAGATAVRRRRRGREAGA